MKRTYDRKGFDSVCVAIFLEAWYQKEESSPPDRQSFLSELAILAFEGLLFQGKFSYAVGFASKDGVMRLGSFLEGFEFAGKDEDFLVSFYEVFVKSDAD